MKPQYAEAIITGSIVGLIVVAGFAAGTQLEWKPKPIEPKVELNHIEIDWQLWFRQGSGIKIVSTISEEHCLAAIRAIKLKPNESVNCVPIARRVP